MFRSITKSFNKFTVVAPDGHTTDSDEEEYRATLAEIEKNSIKTSVEQLDGKVSDVFNVAPDGHTSDSDKEEYRATLAEIEENSLKTNVEQLDGKVSPAAMTDVEPQELAGSAEATSPISSAGLDENPILNGSDEGGKEGSGNYSQSFDDPPVHHNVQASSSTNAARAPPEKFRILKKLVTHFDFERVRDFGTKPLLTGPEVEELLQYKLPDEFKAIDPMSCEARCSLIAIFVGLVDDLNKITLDKIADISGVLNEVLRDISELKALKVLIANVSPPVCTLAEFFDGTCDQTLPVAPLFKQITEFTDTFPPSGESLDKIVRLLKGMCSKWSEFLEKREEIISKALAACDDLMFSVELNSDDCREQILRDLTDFRARVINEPVTAFVEFIPTECRDPLARQCSLHLKNINMALRTNEFQLVHDKVKELLHLTESLSPTESFEAFKKAVREIHDALSESVSVNSSISGELFSSERDRSVEMENRLVIHLEKVCKFSEYYQQLILDLKEQTCRRGPPDLEERNFVLELNEKWILDIRTAFEGLFGTSSRGQPEYFDLKRAKSFLTNLNFLRNLVARLDAKSISLLQPVSAIVNTYILDATGLLDANFEIQLTSCVRLISEKKFEDVLRSLGYIAAFGDILSPVFPFSTSYSAEAVGVRERVYQSLRDFSMHLQATEEMYSSPSDTHVLLTSLQAAIDSEKLHESGLEKKRLVEFRDDILATLVSKLKRLRDMALESKDEANPESFHIFRDCLFKVNGIGNHSLIMKEYLTMRDGIQNHIQRFTMSIKCKCSAELGQLWDDNIDASEGCNVTSLIAHLAQLHRSAVVFSSSHFDEIIDGLNSRLNGYQGIRDSVLVEFQVDRTDLVEAQLRLKFRAEQLLALTLQKLYEEGDAVPENISLLERQCRELTSIVQNNLNTCLERVRTFYDSLFNSLDRNNGIAEFVEGLDKNFDYGNATMRMINFLNRNLKYLNEWERCQFNDLQAWVDKSLPLHYDDVTYILTRSYPWLIDQESYDIFSIEVVPDMFEELADSLRYLQGLKKHHPSTSSPDEDWLGYLECFYRRVERVALRASITQFTQFSSLCTKLGEAIDDYMPPDKKFSQLNRNLLLRLSDNIKRTKEAIMRRDYETAARGLETSDVDDGNSAVLQDMQRLLKSVLISHIKDTRKKIENFNLDSVDSLSMTFLWKNLVQLNKAELYLRQALQVLEIQPDFNSLYELVEELSSQIGRRKKIFNTMISNMQVAEVLALKNSLFTMIESHNCRDLFQNPLRSNMLDLYSYCQRCMGAQEVVINGENQTNEPVEELQTGLGMRTAQLMKATCETVRLAVKMVRNLIVQQTEVARSLSSCCDIEDFRRKLPPSRLLEQFLAQDAFEEEDADISNALTDLIDVVRDQVTAMLETAENCATLQHDAFTEDFLQIKESIEILYDTRSLLPRFKNSNLVALFKKRIEKCHFTIQDIAYHIDMKQALHITDPRNFRQLVQQYLVPSNHARLREAITDAIHRFQSGLETDVMNALKLLHDQLPLWQSIKFADCFLVNIETLLLRLERFLSEVEKCPTRESFLDQISLHHEIIKWTIFNIKDGIFDIVRGISDTRFVDSMSKIEAAVTVIVSTLHNQLNNLREDVEKLMDIITSASPRESELKRMESLHKSYQLLSDYEDLFGVLQELQTLHFCSEVNRPVVLDAHTLVQTLSEICDSARGFFDNLEFVNQETRNENTADRETYYYQVALNYMLLEKTPCLKGSNIGEIDQKIVSSIESWGKLGLKSLQQNIHQKRLDDLVEFNIATSNLHLIRQILPQFDKVATASVEVMDMDFLRMICSMKAECMSIRRGETWIEEIVDTLTALQKIGNVVTVHGKYISRTIDEIVNHHQQQEPLQGREIISRLGVALNECTDGTGQQIIAEHPIFKGYELYLRNTRFTQVSLDHMLDKLAGTDLDKNVLKDFLMAFDGKYWGMVKRYLGPRNRIKFSEIPQATRNLAENGQKHTWMTVLEIIANVFAYWTLSSDNSLYDQSGDKNYLLQPHLGQVIAILRLLCFDSKSCKSTAKLNRYIPWNWFADKSCQLQNHLAQVRTGEGKSVVLGVMSIVLALMNFEVDCVCYSKYLSERDYQDFFHLFCAFGVEDAICYGTFNELCEKKLNEEVDIRAFVEQTVMHSPKLDLNEPAKKSKAVVKGKVNNRILLIDEVDVFFQPGFYGSVYNIFATLKAHQFPEIEKLVLSIWNLRNRQLNEDGLLNALTASQEFQSFSALFSSEWHTLIQHTVKEMLSTLSSFQNHQYIFDGESQRIGYLDNDNTVSFHKVKGYNTMFAYCKEFDNLTITKEVLIKNLHLLIHSASFSYAEIPKKYTGILGVSGTLETLSELEKKILANEYDLKKFTYLCSAYGRETVLWDADATGSITIKKANEFCVALVDEIRRRQGEGAVRRPVLVFFRSRAEIDMFRAHSAFALYRDQALVLYTGMKEENRLENNRKSMEKGRVTLLTREFGRGVNFYCPSKEIEAVGGVHVISTFVSIEISEEVQIMGRTGRQGCSGSFSMILPQSEMEIIGIDETTLDNMELRGNRYSTIHSYRIAAYEKAFPERLQCITQIYEEHKRSEKFVADLKSGDLNDIREYLLSKNEAQYGMIHSRTVILLDATGSMSKLLNQAKLTVSTMLNRVNEILVGSSVASGFEIQFVAYRNYDSHPNKLLECSTWETVPTNLVEFIDSISPDGGCGNEAIEMALWHVNQEAAQRGVTQVIVIGDAPPNSDSEVSSKRASNALLTNHPRYGTPTTFGKELEDIRNHGIRINSFYIKGTRAKEEFQRMANFTGGTCQALDVSNSDAVDNLTGIVSTNILDDIGRKLGGSMAQQLVDSYKTKYPFRTEGFI